jgi:muconolactone delta-isomerase
MPYRPPVVQARCARHWTGRKNQLRRRTTASSPSAEEAKNVEYLVTMITHVPPGTSQEEVDGVRAREAAHTRELAAQGHILRLWRPPQAPGESRTIGLFSAADSDQLEQVLESMPLRVWRTDDATPLMPHPDDPGPSHDYGPGAEFLTTFIIHVPDGTPNEKVDDVTRRESEDLHKLAELGHLGRLWELPRDTGASRSQGLWRARDAAQLERIVESLPLYPWLDDVVTAPLTPHPSDPATAAGAS